MKLKSPSLYKASRRQLTVNRWIYLVIVINTTLKIIKLAEELESYEYLAKNVIHPHIIYHMDILFPHLENSSDSVCKSHYLCPWPHALSFPLTFMYDSAVRFASVFSPPALPGLQCTCRVPKNSQKFSLSIPSDIYFFLLLSLAALHDNLAWSASPSGRPQALRKLESALRLRHINTQSPSPTRNRKPILSLGSSQSGLTISLSIFTQNLPPSLGPQFPPPKQEPRTPLNNG